MTYFADDSGVATSRPVELYEFVNTLGTIVRRTSHQVDVVHGGNTHAATAGLKRGLSTIANGIDAPEMMVELPMVDPLVDAYAGVGVVPQGWTIRITRLQRTSVETEPVFFGYVRSIDLSSDLVAAFRVTQLLDDSPDTPIPNVILSGLCNHTLYDSLCKALRVLHTISPTIVSIDPDNPRIIVVDSVGGFGSDAVRFGDCVHVVSGEKRSVTDHSGTTLTLDVPLPNAGPLAAAPGHVLDVFKGCDRLPTTCRDDFANIINFGGHPNRPHRARWWLDDMRKLIGGPG